MIYYNHFSSVDPYFGRLYGSLLNDIFRSKNRSPENIPETHIAGQLRHGNLNETNQILRHAPEEFSTEEKVLPEIPIEVHQYRLLDEANRPVFATFLESFPHKAFIEDFTFNEEKISPKTAEVTDEAVERITDWYQLVHGLHLRNDRRRLLGQIRQTPPLVLDPYDTVPSRSVIFIPWNEKSPTQVFYAELINNHPESKPRTESLFPDSLRGLGKIEIEQPEPLPVKEGEIVVGDLILGYQKREEDPNDPLRLGFTPAHDLKIPKGENLMIHFEVYQLKTGSDGIAQFEVDYQIRPRDGGLLGWTKKKKDQLSITLNFEHQGNRYTESLEIQTRTLDAGSYELDWIVRDPQSGQHHKQQLHFEVID